MSSDNAEVGVEVVVEEGVLGRGMGAGRSVPSAIALPTPANPPLDLDRDLDLQRAQTKR